MHFIEHTFRASDFFPVSVAFFHKAIGRINNFDLLFHVFRPLGQ